MKNIFFTITALIILNHNVKSQGLKLEPEKYKSFEKWNPQESMGFSKSTLPSKISYRKYTPTPNYQGEYATCVGWAAAYGALSTQQNIQMNITQYMHKWARAFDPLFVYNFLKSENDVLCKEGTSLYLSLDVLEKFGCKPMVWAPWIKCGDIVTFDEFTLSLASQYKIEDWSTVPNNDLVGNTKAALYYKLPVLIGVSLTESFMKPAILGNGIWKPQEGEQEIGGHAMCVIGYDDTKNGGSFEVMNSYGTEFGDNGFVWISYKDYEKLVGEAYIMKTTMYGKNSCSFGDCVNSYSRFKFEDGGIYEGTFTDTYLDGFGSFLYTNGSFYVGGWKMGRKDGYGMLWDEPSRKFYYTTYQNDVLMEYKEKNGFAQSETNKKIKENY